MTIKVASIQIGPVEDELEKTLIKAEEWLDRAAEAGVKLAVFPEGYYPGYTLVFRAKKAQQEGNELKYSELYKDFLGQLEPIPGSATERICGKARKHSMHVVFAMLSITEKRRPANAAILIDDRGKIVHVHRKAHLTPWIERPEFEPGNELKVAKTSLGIIGLAICADLSLPETVRVESIKGAQIICAPTGGFYMPDPKNRNMIRDMFSRSHASASRCIDNSVFLVQSNLTGKQGDFEFMGRSKIINPLGEILAEGEEGSDKEQLVTADLDMEDLTSKKLPFRFIDRRRPELYGDILAPNPVADQVEWKETE